MPERYGGAVIGGGLLAMWITYALTNSIWWAWVAFAAVAWLIFRSLQVKGRGY